MLYHKECGIPSNIKMQVISILHSFKYKALGFSTHAGIELRKEAYPVDIAKVLYHYDFNFDDVFEVNENGGQVEKIGFRLRFNAINDIVFVISKEKTIVTLWTNKITDTHSTLNKQVYAMA